MLLEAAEATGDVRLRFERRVHRRRPATPGALVTRRRHDRATIAERHRGVIIGADGAYSAVRGQLQRRERYDFTQDYLEHGYKELSIPPGPPGRPGWSRNALHIWPRGGFMMIAMPNLDGSFT